MSVSWQIGPDPVYVDGVTNEFLDTTYGEETTVECLIGPTNYSGETYATPQERYDRLKDYVKYGNRVTTINTRESVKYAESGLKDPVITTLLVDIVPASDVDQARGIWGVITGGDDNYQTSVQSATISLDVIVLAEHSFGDRAAVINEFEL